MMKGKDKQMKKVPENKQDVKELLCEQMALLAEKSKACEPLELCRLSEVMIQMSKTLTDEYLYRSPYEMAIGMKGVEKFEHKD